MAENRSGLNEAYMVVRERIAFAAGAAWRDKDRLGVEALLYEAIRRYPYPAAVPQPEHPTR